MRWTDYLAANVGPNGRHLHFPEWEPCGPEIWQFIRSDGLLTAHRVESPYSTWQETIEESMRLADARIGLGAPLPDGMRTREDPDYSRLWCADAEDSPDIDPSPHWVADGPEYRLVTAGVTFIVWFHEPPSPETLRETLLRVEPA